MKNVAVVGAAGHTGRFVVAELRARGFTPVDSFDGALAVISCAGPFADTMAPFLEKALAARIHALSVTAEQAVAMAVFADRADQARDAGIVVAPALGFYGGLGDLVATAALGDWPDADAIELAIALDSWKPTRGTRRTIEKNAGKRFAWTGGRFVPAPAAEGRTWSFPAPFGTEEVQSLSLVDAVTIARHIRTPEVRTYMNLAPLRDLHDPETPAPVPADARGRSDQIFAVSAKAHRGEQERQAVASGRDIYAITAPLVVEALVRILDGHPPGVATAGELGDARSYLAAVSA